MGCVMRSILACEALNNLIVEAKFSLKKYRIQEKLLLNPVCSSMQKSPFVFPALALVVFAAVLGVSSWVSPDTILPLQQPTTTATPDIPEMPPEDSWIIVDLPADATQLEFGAEVYRLVCKACHGDKGQGLTDDWRAQWDPRDQNCWQSKCHARNHPPDGFYMPISPAVVGPPLKIFGTALDLYNYIHTRMPWHDPGSMTEKESWSVTAYILKINNVDPGSDLNAATAAQIRLRADAAAPVDVQVEELNRISPYWAVALIVVIALLFLGILALNRRSTD